MKKTLLSIAITQSVGLAAPALAQDETVLDTIRVVAPSAQTVLGNDEITPEEIERRNPGTVRDVFAGESSVTTSGGAAIATKVMVNGIEESLLSVTIDGARQNKSAFHHAGNVLLDPDLLKKVEVSKGLAPADAGPGGLGGSIAYETKDASDLLEEGDNFGGSVSFTAGNNQSALRNVLSLYGREGNVEGVLSAARSNSDDYEDANGDSVDGTEAKLTNYIGKFAVTSDSGHRVELSISETEDTGIRAAQAGPGGLLFIRPDFAGVVGGDNTFLEGLSRRESLALTYTTTAPQGWFDPTFQLTVNEQEVDVSGAYGKNESVSGTLKNNFDFGTGYVAAGVDFFNEKAEGEVRGSGPFASSGEEKHDNIGIFAQVRQDLGERFSVSYGVRGDSQEFTAADDSTFDSSGISGNALVDVVLSESLTLNAGYASTWGGYELGEAAVINFGGDWTYEGLTTSRADASRLGLRFEQDGFNASFASFRTNIDDLNAILPSGSDRGATSDIESEGFEITLGYNWSSGFFDIDYTSVDVEVDDEVIGTTAYYLGRPVGNIAALEAAQQINDEWRVGGTSEIAMENKLDDSTTLESYSVYNTYIAYEPQQIKSLLLRLDIDNLFDEQYSSRSSDGIGSARVEPIAEPGRSINLTAKYTF